MGGHLMRSSSHPFPTRLPPAHSVMGLLRPHRLNAHLFLATVAALFWAGETARAQPALNVTTYAGNNGGSGSENGTGAAARFNYPRGVAVDGSGNVWVVDSNNSSIRMITPSGVVTYIAGGGRQNNTDGTGTGAHFYIPYGCALDTSGNLYVADTRNNTIRKVAPGGVVTTFAGNGSRGGSLDGTGTAARFASPQAVAVDGSGNVYVADSGNSTIRLITPAGVVSTYAGVAGNPGSADGTGSAASFQNPRGLALDASGNLYVADSGNNTIRKIAPGGIVTTFAGVAHVIGSADGTGTAASFTGPQGLTIDSSGKIYVCDFGNNTIREITPAAVVTTLVGTAGVVGSADGTGAAASFSGPSAVTVDGSGNLYVADTINDTVRKITVAGVVTTMAGKASGQGSTNGTGTAAKFFQSQGVALDNSGNVYVADTNNSTIRKISPGGVVSTLAGMVGTNGSADGTGTAASFTLPGGVAVDSSGNVYVADTNNFTIRKITPGGVVSTLAGTAGNNGSADGTGPAASFYYLENVAVDGSGNIYVADSVNDTIRKITPAGVVTTLAGTALTVGFTDGQGAAASFNDPLGIAVNGQGTVIYAADTLNNTIRQGVMTAHVTSALTAAGSYKSTFSYQITADNTAVSYTASGLPAGLSVNTTNGLISGTIGQYQAAGFSVSISATDANGVVGSGTLMLTVSQIALSVSGMTAASKAYNGTTVAAITGTGTLVGVVGGDNVTLTGAAVGLFASSSVSTGIAVTVTGLTLGGAQAGNYTLTQPTGLTANITASALTLAGLAASNKTYDGTTTATITGSGTLVGVMGADVVNLGGTAAGILASKSVGAGVAVTVSGLTLAGAQAGNYTLTQLAGLTANITAKALTVTGLSASNKVYNGTTAAALSGTAALGTAETAGSGSGADGLPYTGDTVTIGGTAVGTFASASAGTGIAVTVNGLTSSNSNYTLTQPVGLTANITAKALTVTGVTASNRAYNATTAGTLGGAAVLGTAEAAGSGSSADGLPYTGDTVTIGGTAVGTFASKNFGTGIAVAVSGLTSSNGNYTLTPPTGLTANITAKALTVTGLSTSNKVYNGTTAAALSGTAALGTAETAGSGSGADGLPYTGDAVTISGTGIGTFASSGVGTGIAVTVTGLASSNSNYTLTPPAGLTANITAAALTVTGLAASSKPYDGTTTATITGTGALVGIVGSDNVTLTGTPTGTFANANVGTAISVTVSGLTLGGTAAGDYTLTPPILTANITATSQTITFGPLTGKNLGDPAFAVNATASSGLAVTFTVTSGPATIAGNMVTVTGLGVVIISASQAGNSNYGAATAVNQSFTVALGLTVTTLAGTVGVTGSANGVGTAASFDNPRQVAVDASGNIYVADAANDTIRKITAAGVVTTIAGTAGAHGTADGTGSAAGFYTPYGVAVDGSGNLYVADSANDTIRLITPAGVVTTMAGLAGVSGSADGTGSAARFNFPRSMAVDSSGNLYVTDTSNNTIRKITSGGVVTTLAGVAGSAGSADGTGSAARFNNPYGLTVDSSGNLFATDYSNDTIREITPSGAVTTIAGLAGSAGSADGMGSAARFSQPRGVAVDGSDNLYLTDYTNDTIREVTSAGVVTTIAGLAGSNGSADGTGQTARFNIPWGLAVNPSGSALYISDYANQTIRLGVFAQITSATTASGIYGSSFSYQIAASLAAVSYAATGLPTGLSVNASTGAISGTIAQCQAAPFSVTVVATDAQGRKASCLLSLTVSHAALTVTGLSAGNGVYNGTTAATVLGTGTLVGIIGLDNVTLTGTAAGAFASPGVGTAIPVTVSGLALGGTAAANYTLTLPTGLAANITAAPLTVTGLAASNKTYNGTTIAAITGTGTLVGIAGSDNVTLGGTAAGTFTSLGAGTAIPVTVTGLTLAGTAAGNYSLSQPAGLTANITVAALTVTGLAASNKPYDGTTVATITGTGALVGILGADNVTVGGTAVGTFLSADVGTAIPVTVGSLSLGGTAAGNYTLTPPTLSANITSTSQTITFGPLTGKNLGDPAFPLIATADSGLAVTFSVVSGPATIAGNMVSVTGLGMVTISAAQGGSGDFTAAASVNQSFPVALGLTITTLAGTAGVTGSSDGTGSAAQFNYPWGVAMDNSGNGYVADFRSSTIRKITPAGVVTTIAGTAGVTGSSDGTGGGAQFSRPYGVAVDGSGNVYVADTGNSTIREITPSGVVTTIAGAAGVIGGSNGTGNAAQFNNPCGVAVDGSGNIYVADTQNSIIRKITPAGVVTTLAGYTSRSGADGSGYADGAGNVAQFNYPCGVAVDNSGNVYVADTGNRMIRMITPAGVVTTLAGGLTRTGGAGVSGSADGTGRAAQFTEPNGIAVNGSGSAFYVSDTTSDTIRFGQFALITSATAAGGTFGSAFTYQITAGLAAVSYAATGLPTGLSVNPSTGAISGTIGQYQTAPFSVTVIATDAQGRNASCILSLTVSQATLTVVGLSASNAIYNGTTAATLTGTGALVGIIGSDNVTLTGTAVGTFASPGVGTAIPVTVSGLTLGGAAAGNYALIPPAGLTANITAAPLTVTGLSASNKTYDGTATATVTGTASLVGVAGSDNVVPSGTAVGTFANSGVGTGVAVTISGLALSGSAAGNYTLTEPTLSANITAATLTVTAQNATRVFWTANPIFAVAYSGFATGESVATLTAVPTVTTTATTFSNVGNYPIAPSGAAAANYTFNYVNGTLTITQATATVTVSSSSYTYNGAAEHATATTNPSSLTVNLTYNGSATAPAAVGSYAVTGTVGNVDYQGSGTGSLTITKATAVVTLTNLSQAYDGTAKSPSAITSPSGLAVNYTYYGSDGTLLGGAAPSAAGSYLVLAVVNDANYSGLASGTLNILSTPITAAHTAATGYIPGGTVTVTCTITYTGTLSSLSWSVPIPAGWSYAGGTNEGPVKPAPGQTSELDWAWINIPASPVTFSYTLSVPAGTSGPQSLDELVGATDSLGTVYQVLANPDPLALSQRTVYHSADYTQDGQIGLAQLTRFISLYNYASGTTRTGQYHGATGTVDGFAPGPGPLTAYHSADYNHDGQFELVELTRLISLYNYTNGTARTGQYHVAPASVDGFGAGP